MNNHYGDILPTQTQSDYFKKPNYFVLILRSATRMGTTHSGTGAKYISCKGAKRGDSIQCNNPQTQTSITPNTNTTTTRPILKNSHHSKSCNSKPDSRPMLNLKSLSSDHLIWPLLQTFQSHLNSNHHHWWLSLLLQQVDRSHLNRSNFSLFAAQI